MKSLQHLQHAIRTRVTYSVFASLVTVKPSTSEGGDVLHVKPLLDLDSSEWLSSPIFLAYNYTQRWCTFTCKKLNTNGSVLLSTHP